jgi:hypothetical protein
MGLVAVQLNPRLFKKESVRRCTLDECHAACCLYGVWLDILEAEDLLGHANLIVPHMPENSDNPSDWFENCFENDEHSASGRVVHSVVRDDEQHYGGTACVFLRKDWKCALQVAADVARMHPWRFKPFYCILHPLDFDDEGRITLDETEIILSEEGSCLRPSKELNPLLQVFQSELEYLLGLKSYQDLIKKGYKL